MLLLDVLRKLCDASISSRTLSPLHHRCTPTMPEISVLAGLRRRHNRSKLHPSLDLAEQLAAAATSSSRGTPSRFRRLCLCISASSAFLLRLHRLWVFSVQCAFANILQYLLASALLHSTLGRVKILRILLQAPETVEVCKASTLIVVPLQAEPSPLGRSFRS